MFRWHAGALLTSIALVYGCGGGGGDQCEITLEEGGQQPMAPTYANIEMMAVQRCALSSSCHGDPDGETTTGKADLNFARAINEGRPITSVLNDVASCEYPPQDVDGDGENDVGMPRVDPGNPENSWLWIKLAGPPPERRQDSEGCAFDSEGKLLFKPDPRWEHGLEPAPDGTLPPSSCPLTQQGEISFGQLMPQSVGSADPLEDHELKTWRNWIEQGAPGP